MDTEQLKLILDTIQQVAGTASTAGVVWIIVHYFVQLMTVLSVPICWALSVILVARYASKLIGDKQQVASADEQEKTKQKQLELEKARAEIQKSDAVKQLCRIAAAAGVSHSQYSGFYHRVRSCQSH
jgi:ATP/ADP translocase